MGRPSTALSWGSRSPCSADLTCQSRMCCITARRPRRTGSAPNSSRRWLSSGGPASGRIRAILSWTTCSTISTSSWVWHGRYTTARLKEILRLDKRSDRSMWGNDFSGMIDYVLSCPLGRALGLRKSDFGGEREAAATPQTRARFDSYAEDLMDRLRRDQLKDKKYALSVGERRSELAKAGHAAKGRKLTGGECLYQGP